MSSKYNENRFGITFDPSSGKVSRGKTSWDAKKISFREVGGAIVMTVGSKRIETANPVKNPDAGNEMKALQSAIENWKIGGETIDDAESDGGNNGGASESYNGSDSNATNIEEAQESAELSEEALDTQTQGENSGNGESKKSSEAPKSIQELIDKHGIEDATPEEIQEMRDAFDEMGKPVPDGVSDETLNELFKAAQALQAEAGGEPLDGQGVAEKLAEVAEQQQQKAAAASQLLDNADWILEAIQDLLKRVEILEAWRVSTDEALIQLVDRVEQIEKNGGGAAAKTQKIVIMTPTKTKTLTGQLFHKNFAELVEVVSTGQAVALIGPAGTGKTHAAGQVAEVLGLPFQPVGGHPDRDQADLIGYESPINPGQFATGEIRQTYESGGVFFQDEFDTCGPGYIKGMNNFTDRSKQFMFPDKLVERHADFRVILGANTIGQGPDSQYTAAQAQDLSSLDRVYMIEWDLDEQLELAAALSFGEHGQEWVERVRLVRKEVHKGGILGAHVGMRASVNGSMLLASGISPERVVRGLITNHMGEDAQDALEGVLEKASRPLTTLKVKKK